MVANIRRSLLTALLISGVASAQTSLILKTRRIQTDPAQIVLEARGSGPSGGGHLLVQFDRLPSAQHINALTSRGVIVLADVPEDGVLVSVTGPVNLAGLGVRYAAPIAASDKISPMAASNTNGHLLVEFYPDVNLDDARGMLLNAGAVLSDNPDLGPHVLMIQTTDISLVKSVAELDAVSYIFPASDDLAQGLPVRPCVGALTTNGATTQSIPTYGYGWDGPGLGAATVFYYYSNVTSQLNALSAKAEIARAMAQWSSAVKVTWAPGSSATANQTVNILWATYAHGDAYPFDGPGGVLAHTFYPANPNPEPIGGDMHLDDSESWHIGTNTDLFSVTLHELGHALGLGHSDNPSDVMYPYYKMVTGLSVGDIAAIQTLYAAQGTAVTPPPPPPPPTPGALTLTVNATAATTTAATLNLSGAASGGSGTISVTWSTASSSVGVSGSASGTAAAWAISNIALAMGVNTITVTATAGSSHVSQVVTVTRQAAAVTPPTTGGGSDTTPPTLTIASPGATSISTSAATIAFSGTASDNVGVTSVAWSTNLGQSGTASGTTNWSASIPLLVGSNVVTIRAYDAAGNSGWRSVVVTRN
ncbi:MAG TPA: matrixin family metalloprotease [Bryobacteraceae bacterium]|nr:matrixin family metalloprotease [Bryobacteraceae bacterium]